MFPMTIKGKSRLGEYELTIIGEKKGRVNGSSYRRAVAICSCGAQFEANYYHVKHGRTTSCGCRGRATTTLLHRTHGASHSKEYNAFSHINKRCGNPRCKEYKNYGGRGIQNKFTSFEHFISTVGLAPSKKHSIDRIDVNGHYEPGNVQWATPLQQNRNKRNSLLIDFQGKSKLLIEWCQEYKVPYETCRSRIKAGWSPERIFNTRRATYEFKGEHRPLDEWVKLYNLPYWRTASRVKRGWPMGQALGLEPRVLPEGDNS